MPGARSTRSAAPQRNLSSLAACMLNADPSQRKLSRSARRWGMASSFSLQAAALAVLLVLPLFGTPAPKLLARIEMIPPAPLPPVQQARSQQPPPAGHPSGIRFVPGVLHAPQHIPTSIVITDSGPSDPLPYEPGPALAGPGGIPGGFESPLSGPLKPPDPPRVVHITHLDPALLIHRVEPQYPALARQIRRAGRVELHALIAADGSIQSLEVVSGDALFQQSALGAVRQWRYRPTILNGRPVAVDTYITVVYSLTDSAY